MAENSPEQTTDPAQNAPEREESRVESEVAESVEASGPAEAEDTEVAAGEVQAGEASGGETAAEEQQGAEGVAESESDPQAAGAELEALRANEVAFSWQASEYVHHHKGVGWYLGLVGGLAVLAGVAVWLQYWLTVAMFGAMAIALFVYAKKPPRTLTYELTPTGITIDGKALMYSEFRSFGVLPDEEWHQIDLDPVKRFSPRTTILFDDADFDRIVGHLELHLPRIDRKPDLIDRISRQLRF